MLVSQEHVTIMRELCSKLLIENGYTLEAVTTGTDAWNVYHKAGCFNAIGGYNAPYSDGHLQTALEKIFPNVVFKERKTYSNH